MTTLNIITILLSCLAILISISSIIMTRKNVNKQIKINKLEELLEIQRYLMMSFHPLHKIFEIREEMEEIKNTYKENNEVDETFDIYQIDEKYKLDATYKSLDWSLNYDIENLNKLIENQENVFTKLNRMEIIARCYIIDKKLKLQILSNVNLLTDLIRIAYQPWFIDLHRIKYLPDHFQYIGFIDKIENNIIEQMGLGNRKVSYGELYGYQKSQLPRDYGRRRE